MRETTERLWQAFHDRLRRFIRHRVRNGHDTEDLLQEVFAKIHAGLDRLESHEKLEAWVFQVTRRAIIDHVRKLRVRRRPYSAPDGSAGGLPGQGAAADLASCLRSMIEGLPWKDREALRLAELEGRGPKDLAAKLGLSRTGAKSRVQRARRRLKDTLLECCRVETDRRGRVIGYLTRPGSCLCG